MKGIFDARPKKIQKEETATKLIANIFSGRLAIETDK
jgi:hypothetical protein